MHKPYNPQILFVGSNRVGKTTLIGKISGHEVDPASSKPTIKSDFLNKQLVIGSGLNQMTIAARLYDQQFDLIGSPNSIFRQSDVIVLVWSLTDTESYRSIDKHLEPIYNIYDAHNPHPPDIVLCANKCDESRNDNEYNLCCEKYKKLITVKTSARDGTGIHCLESKICNILVDRYNNIISKKLLTVTDTVNIGEDDPPVPTPDPCC